MTELLFFTGTYCPSCRAMYPIIDSIEETFGDRLKIFKIDVEVERDLAALHNIVSIPALLFMKEGICVDRVIGAQIKSKLIQKIEKNL